MAKYSLTKHKEKNQGFFYPSFFPKTRQAQAWSLDIVVATVIFTIGIIVLYFYSINNLARSDESLDNLFYEGNVAAELILSDDSYGILDGYEVNQSRINNFNSSYDLRKASIGVTKNFYFTIDGLEIDGNAVEYIGVKPVTTSNLIQVNRITIYKNKPVKFKLYIWN